MNRLEALHRILAILEDFDPETQDDILAEIDEILFEETELNGPSLILDLNEIERGEAIDELLDIAYLEAETKLN